MSKFKGLFDVAKGRTSEPEPPEEERSPASAPEVELSNVIAAQEEPPTPKKKGRPSGKRSDPDYEQITAYIRRSTYTQVKIALLQQGFKQEFSELLEELLTEWLSTQKSKNAKT